MHASVRFIEPRAYRAPVPGPAPWRRAEGCGLVDQFWCLGAEDESGATQTVPQFLSTQRSSLTDSRIFCPAGSSVAASRPSRCITRSDELRNTHQGIFRLESTTGKRLNCRHAVSHRYCGSLLLRWPCSGDRQSADPGAHARRDVPVLPPDSARPGPPWRTHARRPAPALWADSWPLDDNAWTSRPAPG